MANDVQTPRLKRGLSLPLITLYGVGTTVGAGIYVLIGKIAGQAGSQAPFSFLLAAIIAAFSVFAFAELSSRLPKSAGEAIYLYKAFASPPLSLCVGLMVAMAGLVSAAAISRGFIGYLDIFLVVPDAATITILVVMLGALAAWGIMQSVWIAAFATVIEVGGLLLIIWGGRGAFLESSVPWSALAPGLDGALWAGTISGALLAFYAFIGFEDMVNVAEEVTDARRTLPKAIILTLIITTVCYLALAVIAVRAIPIEQLAAADAPLALVFETTTGLSPAVVAVIAMIAVLNGALVQIIMASRVLYGLSREGWLPKWLGRVNERTQTPLRATLLVTLAALGFALWLPLVTLAEITASLTLTIFAGVNLALIVLKHRDPRPEGVVTYPMFVPVLGLLLSTVFAVLGIGKLF